METFYTTYEQFWSWFNREHSRYQSDNSYEPDNKLHGKNKTSSNQDVSTKRLKVENKEGRARSILETEAATRADARYCVLWGRHKPGKKTKTWEGDGYLSLVGQMAHLCDEKGRMLEEPSVLDEVDFKSVEELGELVIGSTEVQVLEQDR